MSDEKFISLLAGILSAAAGRPGLRNTFANAMSSTAANDVFWAAWSGNLDRIKELQAQNDRLKSKGKATGAPPSETTGDDTMTVEKQDEEDADQEEEEDELIDFSEDTNFEGYTPLMLAASEGHLHIVKYLIEELHVDPNVQMGDGASALYLASEKGFPQVALYLVQHGADVHLPNHNGAGPLYIAAEKGRADVCDLLLSQCNADVNKKIHDGRPPIATAIAHGHTDVVAVLIAKGADITHRFDDGASLLFAAAQEGHAEIARLLLRPESFIDPNSVASDGCSPLYMATQSGHEEVVRLLLDHGADPTLRYNGKTPLMIARPYPKIAAMLKQAPTK